MEIQKYKRSVLLGMTTKASYQEKCTYFKEWRLKQQNKKSVSFWEWWPIHIGTIILFTHGILYTL